MGKLAIRTKSPWKKESLAKKLKVIEDNRWLLQLIDDQNIATDISYDKSSLTTVARNAMCVVCKGAKALCGKTSCPIVVRLKYYFKTMPLIDSLGVDGASPPGVFVGRIGYPYVYAGPLVPPVHEDTSLYDLPELWFGKSIDDIVAFRSILIRGKHRVHVQRFEDAGKIMDRTRELALSMGPVDVELALKNKPQRALVLDDEIQPFGPSALLRDIRVGASRWDHQIEKAYDDTDLKAVEAVTALYDKGVLVSRIQRAFSVGSFGLKDNRRLVPTRWSITAVDSIISKDLIEEIKTFPEINEFRVYESRYLDNRFEVLMMPGAWSYEIMEAWYPGTVWNPMGRNIVVFSDWEGFEGRTTYASIGGCYYAARLAVGELLAKERRQAVVVVLREAHPGYIMPVGVWQVRENLPDQNITCQSIIKYAPILEQYAQHMRLNGRKEATIKTVTDRFTLLIKHGADLDNPDTVKEVLAKLQWQNITKHVAISSYTAYLRFRGLTWIKPKYTPQEKLYFIPTEQEIDTLISASGKTLAPLLQLLKETGIRIGEATAIEWTDIDHNNKTVAINHPEKGSLPRLLKISDKLILMLNELQKTNKPIFLTTTTQHGLRITFEDMRKRTATKLGNPRLLKIHFHTFRHYKGTTMFLKQMDSYFVRQQLGHKTAVMTDKYINIAKTLMNTDEEYTSKCATTKEEICQLIENGYTKADEIDGIHIYKKRK